MTSPETPVAKRLRAMISGTPVQSSKVSSLFRCHKRQRDAKHFLYLFLERNHARHAACRLHFGSNSTSALRSGTTDSLVLCQTSNLSPSPLGGRLWSSGHFYVH